MASNVYKNDYHTMTPCSAHQKYQWVGITDKLQLVGTAAFGVQAPT